MGRVVKDEKELAQAIKNNVDYIEVEGGIKDFFISKSVFKSVPSKSKMTVEYFFKKKTSLQLIYGSGVREKKIFLRIQSLHFLRLRPGRGADQTYAHQASIRLLLLPP